MLRAAYSTYDRNSSRVIKFNRTLHIFLISTYNRRSNAVMKMYSTIHHKLEQYV